MSEQLYKQNAANANPGAGETNNSGTNTDGTVYDADYKVEEDGNDNQ